MIVAQMNLSLQYVSPSIYISVAKLLATGTMADLLLG